MASALRWTGIRYRDPETGRYITRAQVQRALEQGLASVGRATDQLAEDYDAGRITLATWRDEMRDIVKQLNLASTALAQGGIQQLTTADLTRLRRETSKQYAYLDDWIADLRSGKATRDAMASRARLYVRGARTHFLAEDTRNAQDQGFDEIRTILHPAEHCAECLAEAARGWIPIGLHVPVGSRTCMSNDRCTVEYRRRGLRGAPPATATEAEPAAFVPLPRATRTVGGLAVRHAEGTSAAFRAEVEQTIEALPEAVRQSLAGAGVKIDTAADLADIVPGGQAMLLPSSLDGVYDTAAKRVYVAEAPDGERSTRIPGVMRHELGHAADRAIKGQSLRFLRVWQEEWRAMEAAAKAGDVEANMARGTLAYYKDPTEAWAESFGINQGGGAGTWYEAAFRRFFSRTLAVVADQTTPERIAAALDRIATFIPRTE